MNVWRYNVTEHPEFGSFHVVDSAAPASDSLVASYGERTGADRHAAALNFPQLLTLATELTAAGTQALAVLLAQLEATPTNVDASAIISAMGSLNVALSGARGIIPAA
jgi:hypothetical protein